MFFFVETKFSNRMKTVLKFMWLCFFLSFCRLAIGVSPIAYISLFRNMRGLTSKYVYALTLNELMTFWHSLCRTTAFRFGSASCRCMCVCVWQWLKHSGRNRFHSVCACVCVCLVCERLRGFNSCSHWSAVCIRHERATSLNTAIRIVCSICTLKRRPVEYIIDC